MTTTTQPPRDPKTEADETACCMCGKRIRVAIDGMCRMCAWVADVRDIRRDIVRTAEESRTA